MISLDAIQEVLLGAKASPLATEEAARLVEGWLDASPLFPETLLEWRLVGVEVPFYVQLEEKSFVIGVTDAIFQDADGPIFCEWKSRRAPKIRKDGKPYEGDDEDGWLEDISNGPQLALYALAATRGRFLLPLDRYGFFIPSPRILVRAVVKSSPVQLWPAMDWRKGMFVFHPAGVEAAWNAMTVKCRQIRSAREGGLIPWQLVGEQCENKYRRVCAFRDQFCRSHHHLPMREGAASEPSETRDRVCKALSLDPSDPELVMLSASGLAAFTQCMELGRIRYEADLVDAGESSFALEVGGVMHQGIAAILKGE